MTRTTKKRRKISSAAGLRAEDAAGQRDPESDRNRLSPVVGWEALAAVLAEAALVARAGVQASAAACPLARRPAARDRALPRMRGVRHSAPGQRRPVGARSEQASAGQLAAPGPQGVLRAPAAERPRKPRRNPPAEKSLEPERLPQEGRRANRVQGVERRPGKQARQRKPPERVEHEKPQAGNRPPGVAAARSREEPQNRAAVAEAVARSPRQKVAPGGRFFLAPCAFAEARLLSSSRAFSLI
jgi:hypothetical protein